MRSGARSFGGSFVGVALILAVLVSLVPRPAWAGARERLVAHDAKLDAALRATNPKAADLFRDATRAQEANDFRRAIELYQQVTIEEPNYSPAFRRLGRLLVVTGKTNEGLSLSRRAVQMDPSTDNRLGLALALTQPVEGKPLDRVAANEALSLARAAAGETTTDIDSQLIFCQIATTTGSVTDVQSCAGRVVALAPEEPEPYIFVAVAAASRGDRDAAHEATARARRLGLDEKTAALLDAMIDASEPPLFRWGKRLGLLTAGWLAGLGLLFVLGSALSRRTLELSKRLAGTRDAESMSGGMRRTYRALLHVASAYYYASLPLVLLLSVLAGAGVIIAFLYIGRIPIYLIVVAVTVVAYTIKSVIQSLVIRARDEDPGTRFDVTKHPRLARVLEEVAKRVGTRPVDELFLTPHAEMAVIEHGGFLRQLRGTTSRRLILGVGVLEGLRLQPFKAVLAHEYGHFSNRDTAGGGVALGVRRSLLHTAIGLIRGGAAAWYNPAWLFVVNFQRVFLRISQGASRLQEVMADRVAAAAYGPEAFAEGLRHVIRRGIELDAHVETTVREVVDGPRVLSNLYRYVPATSVPKDDIEAKIAKALDAEPSPYDSHPKPADRIQWVQEVRSSLAPTPDDGDDVWCLFEDREAVELLMTSEIRTALAAQGVVVAASPPT